MSVVIDLSYIFGYNNDMQKHELLAPAGDLDAGYAALYYGADAVYLGLKSFSARASATNFSPEELNEFTAYAHHLNRKVYVTVNTLIQQSELDELLKTLDVCSACQVDGVILQDFGVAHIVKNYYPNLAMHASTQMAVHNVAGALALKKLGFTRVVLARELTLSEIQKIAAIPDLETEVFIHGALCYAYSGLCLFSSMESGRSANRGKCAYPCRSLFKMGTKEGHFFSMKDLALGENVLKLPICSLKIEGRKKKDLYVAAVVDYYRRILDTGKAEAIHAEHIKQIFSRPWTTFHVLGKNADIIDTEFVGHRGLPIGQVENVLKQYMTFTPKHTFSRYDGLQLDIPGQEKPFGFSVQEILLNGRRVFDTKAHQKVQVQLPPHSPFITKGTPVYLASSGAVKATYHYEKPKPNEYKIRPEIEVQIQLTKDKITATAHNNSAVLDGPFEQAQNVEKMNENVMKVFEKYKDTDFLPRIKIKNKDNVFVPVSLLNQLRRNLYEQIQITQKVVKLPVPEPRRIKAPQWLIKTDNPNCLSQIDLKDFAEIILLLTPEIDLEKIKVFPKNKVRLALPAIARDENVWQDLVQKVIRLGYYKWEIANVWGLHVLPRQGIDLSFDSSLYCMNLEAIQMADEMGAKRITLSVEDTLNNMTDVAEKSPLAVTAVVYQDIPLFTSANCIKNNCAHCNKQACTLPIQKGKSAYFAQIKNCTLTLIDNQPFDMGKPREQIPADFYRIDFINRSYTPEQVADSVQKILSNTPLSKTHHGNLKKVI